MGENAKLLGLYYSADTLLFLYAWEKRKSDAYKFAYSVGYGLGFGLVGMLQAKLGQTSYYKPNHGTWFGVYAATGFIMASTINPDAYIAACALIVETESGRATWYNFSHFNSGGMYGDRVGRIAKELLKQFPEKR